MQIGWLRKLISAGILLAGLSVQCFGAAGEATPIRGGGTLPTTCQAAATGKAADVFVKTADGFYLCTSTNTWSGPFLATVTPHNLLSATHPDTTPASPTRGDGIFAIGSTPTWTRLAHPSVTGGYFKWNGTDVVASTLAASGTGTPTACTNQVVTGFTLAADAAPTSTCTSLTGSFLPNPSASTLGGTESKDCTGIGHVVTISTSGVPTCSADGGGGGGTVVNPYAVPSVPTDPLPYTGMWFWLSADCTSLSDGSTCVAQGNNTVIANNQWADRSGHWWNFRKWQGTATVFTNVINGQPVVRFSASAAFRAFNMDFPLMNWREAITAFAVIKNTNGTQGGLITGASIGVGAGNNSFYWRSGSTTNKEQGVDRQNVAELGNGTAAVDTVNFHQINVQCTEGTNPVFRIDRTADATISGANCAIDAANDQTYTIGVGWNHSSGTQFFTGDIAEIIVYGRLLSSTEVTQVETYLHDKYGL